jgi:hypothetical protein
MNAQDENAQPVRVDWARTGDGSSTVLWRDTANLPRRRAFGLPGTTVIASSPRLRGGRAGGPHDPRMLMRVPRERDGERVWADERR